MIFIYILRRNNNGKNGLPYPETTHFNCSESTAELSCGKNIKATHGHFKEALKSPLPELQNNSVKVHEWPSQREPRLGLMKHLQGDPKMRRAPTLPVHRD